MKLHELSSIKTSKNQRIGHGGKRGSYSGRGQKGQRSRSGHRIRPAERDIILKLPKMRGFRNKPKADIPEVFNLNELSKALAALAAAAGKTPLVLNHELFRKAKLVRKDYKRPIKILGTGEIAFPIAVHGFEVSQSAKIKIEKAGGKVS
jgi:large subunit ribosomal protein L15